MQAVGMVQDHTLDCFRYHELTEYLHDKQTAAYLLESKRIGFE